MSGSDLTVTQVHLCTCGNERLLRILEVASCRPFRRRTDQPPESCFRSVHEWFGWRGEGGRGKGGEGGGQE